MPILSTGQPTRRLRFAGVPRLIQAAHRRPAAGFTLLEIMIVMVVIGLLVGIFTLSMGSFASDDGSEEVRRFNVLIQMATEEATMQGRDLGLRFYQSGYEFSARLPRTDKDGRQVWEWLPLDDDRVLRPRQLGDEFSIQLELEDRETILTYERDTRETYQPQVFLLSSGDIEPPFTLRVRRTHSGPAYQVTVSSDGQVEVSNDAS